MSNEFELEISDELKDRGITRIAKENNTIVIHYNENSIRFDIDYKSWMRTIKNFEDEAKGIINDVLLKSYLKTFLNDKYKEILENDNNTSLDNIKNNGKEIVKIFKYSKYGKIPLHEAAILDDKPIFIKYDHDNKRIETVENIVETTRIIIPPPRNEYPYTSYEFENLEELNKILEMAKGVESIDYLYKICKITHKKYIDQDDHIIAILAADCILTYFQDLFPAIHYSEGIGDNDVGKSSIGYTFEYTGYRVVKGTSISGANYYRVLGTDEPGQCVIIEDEGDSISDDSDKVKILKSGYEYNGQVPKINMNSKNQEQKWFKTYCYKMILAEKSLSHYKAKGLVDRTFSFHCRPGKVKQSIKEVVSENINKSPSLQTQFKEILDFRKLLLLYRLLHYRDPLPRIETGLKNRDNELCKPLLQLFFGTKALDEIISALKEFVKQRKERKANSLEAALYPIIKKIINSLKKDSLYNYQKSIQISFSDIWNEIIDEYDGIEGIEVNSNQYETLDYGPLYKNSLSKSISDKFGATIHRKSKGSIIIFDLEKFEKFEEIYGNDKNNSNEVDIDVKLVVEDTTDRISDIDNSQLQKLEDDNSNNENIIDVQSDDDSKEGISVENVGCVSYVGKSKCVDSITILKDKNDSKTENLENSNSIDEGNVSYVGNVGISARASINKEENEKDILTNNNSMKANSQNNNLPIFNYNNNKIDSLFAADKKRDTHSLEPTYPTLPTSLSGNNKKEYTHLQEPTQPTLLTSAIIEDLSTLQCSMCDYMGIEVDMEVHLVKEHRYEIKKRDDIPGGDFDSKINVILERLKTPDKVCYASTTQ
jgi:hypothetical protein